MQYSNFSLEMDALSKGVSSIAGVDEAGRGCIAGPVVAAVVMISDESQYIPGVWDSKLMTASAREEMYDHIREAADEYGIGQADELEIDRFGIGKATALAMKRAYNQLSSRPELVLIDGRRITTPHISRVRIKAGDRKHYVISAASVLAKVTRDRIMRAVADQYPGYGFENHVGYGTKAHIAAICLHGVLELHRKSYSPIKEIIAGKYDRTSK